MSIYITNTYALEETAIASRAQRIVKEEAKKLGIKEIRIPYVDYGSEDRNNMSKKIDGVLTGVFPGDTVIYQSFILIYLSASWNDLYFVIFSMNIFLGI